MIFDLLKLTRSWKFILLNSYLYLQNKMWRNVGADLGSEWVTMGHQTGHFDHSVQCHPCQNSNYKVYGGGHCQQLPYTHNGHAAVPAKYIIVWIDNIREFKSQEQCCFQETFSNWNFDPYWAKMYCWRVNIWLRIFEKYSKYIHKWHNMCLYLLYLSFYLHFVCITIIVRALHWLLFITIVVLVCWPAQ